MLSKLLAITVLIVSTLPVTGRSGPMREDDCEKINVSITISDATEGKQDGKIEIVFDKQRDFSVFLFASEPSENQLEVKEKTIENLKRGTYNLYVQVEKKCTKHFVVEIK